MFIYHTPVNWCHWISIFSNISLKSVSVSIGVLPDLAICWNLTPAAFKDDLSSSSPRDGFSENAKMISLTSSSMSFLSTVGKTDLRSCMTCSLRSLLRATMFSWKTPVETQNMKHNNNFKTFYHRNHTTYMPVKETLHWSLSISLNS